MDATQATGFDLSWRMTIEDGYVSGGQIDPDAITFHCPVCCRELHTSPDMAQDVPAGRRLGDALQWACRAAVHQRLLDHLTKDGECGRASVRCSKGLLFQEHGAGYVFWLVGPYGGSTLVRRLTGDDLNHITVSAQTACLEAEEAVRRAQRQKEQARELQQAANDLYIPF